MIFITFNCNNFNFKFLTFYFDQLFKSLFNMINQKNFSSISWTKYKMIIYQRYGCICMSVFIFHTYIIYNFVYKIKLNIHIFVLSIPHLKELAFRTFLLKIKGTSIQVFLSTLRFASNKESITFSFNHMKYCIIFIFHLDSAFYIYMISSL